MLRSPANDSLALSRAAKFPWKRIVRRQGYFHRTLQTNLRPLGASIMISGTSGLTAIFKGGVFVPILRVM